MDKNEKQTEIDLNQNTKKPFIRSPYNYDRRTVSIQTAFVTEGESLTVQSQKQEADINYIVKQFGLTGKLPDGVRMPEYGDFTGITDYRSALDSVMAAQDAFAQMPANIRERFKNDPAEFVNFCLDDKNRKEAESMGLVPKTEAPLQRGVPPSEAVPNSAKAEKTTN